MHIQPSESDTPDFKDIHIGQIFLSLAPILKMYRVYAENYTVANQILRNNEQNPTWTQFLKETKQDIHDFGIDKQIDAMLTLDSLLIMPIQRIPYGWFIRGPIWTGKLIFFFLKAI